MVKDLLVSDFFLPGYRCRNFITSVFFVGLYFLTALLDLHSDMLLKMNAVQIKQWFEDIETNKENWFSSLHFTLTGEEGRHGERPTYTVDGKTLSWDQFTNGWIRATAGKFHFLPLFTLHSSFLSPFLVLLMSLHDRSY
jgi:hypothetical protein